MKVQMNYTTRTVTVLEQGIVFQHSHNVDYIQVAIDQYTPGLVYKLNFTDASGNRNLSRVLEYLGQNDDLYYFKLPLNSDNTKYEGDLAMSMSIFTQETEDEVTTTTKIWNSETFYQYIDASEEDETIDIDSEETTIINEIYAAIALKLNITHKGYFKYSELLADGTTLPLDDMTTSEFLVNCYSGLRDVKVFDGIAIIVNDIAVITDLPTGVDKIQAVVATRNDAGTLQNVGYIEGRSSVTTANIYYGLYRGYDSTGFSGWKRYLNDTDLSNITDGTTIVNKATNDKDGNPIDTTYLKKAGGTMAGTLNMGGQKIINLASGTNSGEAATKGQMDTALAFKEDKANKVTTVAAGATNDEYYSALAVFTKLLDKVETSFTIAGLTLEGSAITLSQLKTAIGDATNLTNGLMTAAQVTALETLVAYFDDDADSVINKIHEVFAILEDYPEGTNLIELLADKVDKVEGKALSTNDLTDLLKTGYDAAVVHANKTDGTNPHLTTFANIVDKPTTHAGYGLANGEVETIEATTSMTAPKFYFGSSGNYIWFNAEEDAIEIVMPE